MSDRLPTNSRSTEPHVPWESIGANEPADVITAADTALSADLPLTPWTERPAEPATESAVHEIPTDAASIHEAPPDVPHIELKSAPPLALPAVREGGWTITLLCAGIGLIACCVLIPQADLNRRLAYERLTLQRDLDSIEKQIAVNREFLKKVGEDPTLAERLAERQMKVVPQGSRVLALKHDPDNGAISPFQLLNVAQSSPLPQYRPVSGALARLCYDARTRLYLIGAALCLMATGLVMGYAPASDRN